MSHQNSNPVPEPDLPSPSGLNAQSQMGLPEILQMCCLSRRSGQITFRSGASYGYIYIQQGRVLHALCGTIEGEEAIYNMLSWPGGGFSLDEDILPHKKTVTLTWEQLLFEGARRADEGLLGTRSTSAPITTTEPSLSIRPKDSQPKLTILRPDLPQVTIELTQEYTHVGRASGNEIFLPYPSVSNRHCIFILSGPDVVLRDLNSSNGTLVNGAPISETILRPADTIQVGVVQIQFEESIKRPKLKPQDAPAPAPAPGDPLLRQSKTGTLIHGTVKLPERPQGDPQPIKAVGDTAYVQGVSAINYSDLAPPEEPVKKTPWLMIGVGGVVLLIIIAAAAYFFFLR
ncbi:MAG: DUF4388 domain-containing protein [Methylacidiphilales bacterium]|nr:DUF4388 domain-containing protein [Candidatus Methylacidiphilales bacterium]